MKTRIIIILLTGGILVFMYILLNTSFIYVSKDNTLKKDLVSNKTDINNDYEKDPWSVLKQEWLKEQENDLISTQISDNTESDEPTNIEEKDDEKQPSLVDDSAHSDIPKEVNLEVQFYSQAPDKIWVHPWKEACEESSLVQAYYYVIWKPLSKEKFKEEVLNIVEFEKNIFWDYVDTSIEQTANILENYFAYKKYKIIDNPSIEDIKYELSQGNPVIAPFAWQMLNNPHFVGDWPRYHMFVIVGYDENNFITNDVGTYMGENYIYSYETIMNALHDLIPNWEWDITTWKKKILVIEK